MEKEMKAWLKKYNIFTWLISVLISVLIWFFVVSQLNPDMDARFKNIDIQITDIEQLTANGLAIVSGGNETADVKVRGKRDKVALLEADSFKITASVASITVPGTYNLSYNIDVPDVSVVAKTPSQISVVIDHISSKTVPAEIKFTGKMPEGYILQDYDLSPDAIIVKGPESQLDMIKQAVVNFDLTNNKKSQQTTLSYTFYDGKGNVLDIDGLTVDTPAIVFSSYVVQVKTVPLVLDVISEGMYAENIATITVGPKEIEIMGDPSVVAAINRLSVGTVNLKTMLKSHQTSVQFDIDLPDGVTTEYDGDTAQIKVEPQGYGYGLVVLTADNFEPIEGYSYLKGATIAVEVFGQTNVVNRLLDTDMIVKVMSISKDESSVTATVSLDISCKYEDIDVLGAHTLHVLISDSSNEAVAQ